MDVSEEELLVLDRESFRVALNVGRDGVDDGGLVGSQALGH